MLYFTGPFTALIPTNTAFADLDEAFIEGLLDPANTDDLRNFLLYHMLPGATLTTEFTAGPAETLFADNTVDVSLDPIQFNDANVITGDIVACNGYINIIDTVLNPFGIRKFLVPSLPKKWLPQMAENAYSIVFIIFSPFQQPRIHQQRAPLLLGMVLSGAVLPLVRP